METQTTTENTILDRLLAKQVKPAELNTHIYNEKARRYIWYPGEDIPSEHLEGGYIQRCRLTPILAWKTWEIIWAVPEHLRIDVRGGPEGEAAYELQPGWILDEILQRYELWGVRELKALYDWPLLDVIRLNLDGIFSPWRKSRDYEIDEIPKPYRIIRQHIESVLETNKDKTIRKVGEDMLQSIAASEAYDVVLVDEEESRAPIKYSKPGFRALSRLERRHKDHAIADMAAVQNAVFSKLPDIISAQTEVNPSILALLEQQQKQIELLTRMLDEKPKKAKE